MEKSKKRKEKGKKKSKAEQVIGDRVTYSETVRCNIGDYEHRDVFVSLGTNVMDGESNDDAYVRARDFVRKKLSAREKKIRTLSQEYVDFDTKAKLI